MAVEAMHNTKRVHGHPSRIIMTIEGMKLKLTFKKLKKMKHLTSLEKLNKKFENPPPINALEQLALNIITARIHEIESMCTQVREEKTAKKIADEAKINAKAKKSKMN